MYNFVYFFELFALQLDLCSKSSFFVLIISFDFGWVVRLEFFNVRNEIIDNRH